MEEIIISYEVRNYLIHLTNILYQRGYFGFLETAEEYVNNLIDEILQLPSQAHHETPNELKKYGTYYIKIENNKRTMWYVFFEKNHQRYLIQFVTNNHAPQSEFLNRL